MFLQPLFDRFRICLSRPHKSTVRVYRAYKRSLDVAFPSCHYMDALMKAGLQSLEQRKESLCESFVKEIQHPEHK